MGAKGGTSGNTNLASLAPATAGAFPEQTTPFGSVEIDRNFAGFPTQVTSTFSPEVQALQDQLFGQVGQPINLPSFAPGDFNQSMQAAEQATLDRALSLLNPQFERQEEQLRQRLANQGLPQASRAFTSEVGRFEQGRDRTLEDLALGAVLAGQGVQAQGFGQQLAGQQQNVQQQLTERQLPFSELSSLFGLATGTGGAGQFVNVPQFQVPFAQEQPGIPTSAIIAQLLGQVGGGFASGFGGTF